MLFRPLSHLRLLLPIVALLLIYRYLIRDPNAVVIQSADPNPPTKILIPKVVHQLLIDMPSHPVAEFRPNAHSISWQQSGYKIEYWNEESCYDLAKELDEAYADAFELFPTAVLRSDFCRYLIMYGRGGIYNDLDVHLVKPLPWNIMGTQRKGQDPPQIIIGLEGNALTRGLPRSPQFVQWTIASAPNHPILKDVLDRISSRTVEFLEKSKKVKEGDEMDIMNWTGPSVWTDAVLAYLGHREGEKEYEELRDLKEAMRIKDVVLLPKMGFAVTAGEDHKSRDIFVKHYFSGTWKAEARRPKKSKTSSQKSTGRFARLMNWA